MTIAFLGLGNMGAPMAANLARAGFRILGYDPAGAQAHGVVSVGTAREAVADSDTVITMLPNGAILRSVYDEVLTSARPNTLFVDCSTVSVDEARAAAAQALAAGHLAADAPVSGGTAGAMAATLTFMVGASDAAFDRAQPLLQLLGKRVVHCGAAGAGQAAKICNNMILGITMIGTCEAIALADKLGLDRQALYDVVSTSSGQSWVMNSYCPAPGIGPQSPADNGYHPGFAAELMLKDLDLSQVAASSVDAATPLGAQATALYRTFVQEGGRGRDFSAMLLHLAEMGHAP